MRDARAVVDEIRAAGGEVRPGMAKGVPLGVRDDLLRLRDEVRALVAGEVCVACGEWVGPETLLCPRNWCAHPTRLYDHERKLVLCSECGAPAGTRPWRLPVSEERMAAAVRAARSEA